MAVSCTTNSYAIGGTVSGLAGMGLTLQNEGGDDLTVMADGTFVFPTSVLSGQAYDVTIAAQPVNPWQTCTVAAGSGGVAGADITNVAITCTTNAYPVGGNVSGLASSVTLHNGADTVVVSSNGAFVFPTAVQSGGAYAVSVTAQPNNPTQTCTVSSGAGSVAGAGVTSVAVACVTNTYAVGGLASGVLGTGLTLQDNAGDDLVVNGDGTFTFPTRGAQRRYVRRDDQDPAERADPDLHAGGRQRIDRRIGGHQRQRQLLDQRVRDRRHRDGPDRQRAGHSEQRRR